MGRSSRRQNFLIEEDIYRDLEKLVPPGKRSQVVNTALRKELELIRRKKAVEQLYTLSEVGKTFASQEIVEILSADRGGH
jgi:hypothetical protein